MVKICEQRAAGRPVYVPPDSQSEPAPDDGVILEAVSRAAYRKELPFRHIRCEFWHPLPPNLEADEFIRGSPVFVVN